MKIIVTGSLGHISRPLTEQLLQKGHSVTVISSNPEKQKDIEALGAKAAVGTMEDIDFLTTTFMGADAVYCMMPPRQLSEPDYSMYGRRIGGKYAKAIRQAGIRRAVHLSSWGAELEKGTGFIIAAHESEKMLDELHDVAIVHIRPTSFYYNLFSFIPMIKAAGFIAANYGDEDGLIFVAPSDIADAIAEELETPGTGRKIRYVASDECTCNDTARIIGLNIGMPGLKWKTLTNEQLQANLAENGVPEHAAMNIVELGAASHNGTLRKDYDLHKPVLGKVKLEDFVKDFIFQFNKK